MSSNLEQILNRLGLTEIRPLFESQGIEDGLLADLTDEDLEKIGIGMLGHRKRLLAAFAEVEGAAPRLTMDPLRMSRDTPFVNDLGLPFVPVAGRPFFFCVWPLRVKDYEVYRAETGERIPSFDFEQGPEHPVVGLTWDQAVAFGDWLTERDRKSGLINDAFVYRLPRDREWSTAVGLELESGSTPELCSGKNRSYPWGADFPPPRGAGNYHPSLGVDDFRETSPVGSFAANRFGIYDLGGNVWEWCQDLYGPDNDRRVLRGASCFNDDEEYILSSYREKCLPSQSRNNVGVRLVLAPARETESWF